jgi:hypothetical protein
VLLAYDYSTRVALLEDPGADDISPHLYPLCTGCAEGLRLPIGWELVDRRSKPPLFAAGPERGEHLGEEFSLVVRRGA